MPAPLRPTIERCSPAFILILILSAFPILLCSCSSVNSASAQKDYGVFIGANTNLIAPVTVGDGAYIAAASTVTKDVPAGSFVIGRVREEHTKQRE